MHAQARTHPPRIKPLHLHRVNKELKHSSKAKDEFAPAGFLCFVNKFFNEPTILNISNLGFRYSIYSWQPLSYLFKELLLQQILVPVVIQRSTSSEHCHGTDNSVFKNL